MAGATKQQFPPVPKRCVVTGGMGFVGRRLVEMLVDRGAAHVVAFDIAPKPEDAGEDPRITWMRGDLTNPADVEKACEVRVSHCTRSTSLFYRSWRLFVHTSRYT